MTGKMVVAVAVGREGYNRRNERDSTVPMPIARAIEGLTRKTVVKNHSAAIRGGMKVIDAAGIVRIATGAGVL